MGLALVELGMAIEDEFQVPIPDEVYGELKTVGCLHWWLCGQLGVPDVLKADDGLCLHPAAFVRVRKSIVSTLGVDRSSVRLSNRLAELVPRSRRRAIWPALVATSGIEWPALVYSRPVRISRVLGFSLLAIFLGTACGIAILRSAGWWVIPPVIVAAAVGSWLIDRICQREELPPRLATIGDLTVCVARTQQLHLRSLVGDDITRRQFDIYSRLRAIVSDKLDVPLDQVQMTSRFIQDLHAD